MNIEEKIQNIYKGESGKRYHEDKHYVSNNMDIILAKHRSAKMQPYIKESDDILEFGVGGGWNIQNVRCKSKIGYDIADSLNEILSKKGIQLTTNLDDLKGRNFDVIICRHVLEHTPNPVEILGQIKPLLSENGIFIAVVPYETLRKYRKYREEDRDFHIYSWNPQSFTNLFKFSGYKVLDLKLISFAYDRFTAALIDKYSLSPSLFDLIFKVLNFIRPFKEIFIVVKKDSL